EGEELTPFEQDLQPVLSRGDTAHLVQDALLSLVNKQLINLSIDQLRTALDRLKKKNQEQVAQVRENMSTVEMKRKYKVYTDRLRDISRKEKSKSDRDSRDIEKERKKIQSSTTLSDSER